MMAPWPAISRGTECTVPMVPGLVSVMVVPAKSSTVSLLLRAFLTMSSYAVQNRTKSSVSAALMLGTSSWREPSGFCRSMARPRLTWAGCRTTGLPSCSPNAVFIAGIRPSALTSAYPMMWVNDTLPPRERDRWLLMTTRLSMSSLAGTERTLVAVGTVSEVSMLATTRAAGPRSGVVFSSAGAGEGAAAGAVGPAWLGAAFGVGMAAGAVAPLLSAAALSAVLSATAVSGTGGAGDDAGAGASAGAGAGPAAVAVAVPLPPSPVGAPVASRGR